MKLVKTLIAKTPLWIAQGQKLYQVDVGEAVLVGNYQAIAASKTAIVSPADAVTLLEGGAVTVGEAVDAKGVQ